MSSNESSSPVSEQSSSADTKSGIGGCRRTVFGKEREKQRGGIRMLKLIDGGVHLQTLFSISPQPPRGFGFPPTDLLGVLTATVSDFVPLLLTYKLLGPQFYLGKKLVKSREFLAGERGWISL